MHDNHSQKPPPGDFCILAAAAVAAAGSLLAGAAKGKGGDAMIADAIKQVRTGLN